MSTIAKNGYRFNTQKRIFTDFNGENYKIFTEKNKNLIKYNDDLLEALLFFQSTLQSMEDQRNLNVINRLVDSYYNIKESYGNREN